MYQEMRFKNTKNKSYLQVDDDHHCGNARRTCEKKRILTVFVEIRQRKQRQHRHQNGLDKGVEDPRPEDVRLKRNNINKTLFSINTLIKNSQKMHKIKIKT